MIANYHSHTTRCRHAEGTEREYIERALQGGLKILGFSDHTPYLFPGDYYSNFRMFPDQLPDYVETLEKLRQEYKDRIELHIGLEVEFYPHLFGKLMDYLKGFPIEYILLGQHFLGDEQGEPASAHRTSDPQILDRYVGQVIDGMQTGLFTYLAHPDVIHYVGDDALYEKQMRRLCRAANDCHMPVEINFLGISGNRSYPNETYWRIAGEEGCRVVLGCDAHETQQVWHPETLAKGEAIARRYQLNVLETVDLVKPF